jgi:hypothetical protein
MYDILGHCGLAGGGHRGDIAVCIGGITAMRAMKNVNRLGTRNRRTDAT